nr:ribonuclease H-like domain-containing protein [Tanacetum cinerariifolium]
MPSISFHIIFAMSTQQDIYAAGSENRPPMLNKDNYVPWSSCLLCYAKSKPNGKLLVHSIKNGSYVEVNELKAKRLARTHDPLALMANSNNPYNYPSFTKINHHQLTTWIANQTTNKNKNGNAIATCAEGNVRPRRRDAAYLLTQLLLAQEEAEIQLQDEEFDLMATARNIDEIKEVNANCILMEICRKHRHRVLILKKLPSMIQMD